MPHRPRRSRHLLGLCTLLLALPAASLAQAGRVQLPDFGDLAKRATNSVVITLDGDLLRQASQFMGQNGKSQGPDALLRALKGVYVRSFKFAHDHQYSQADVDFILRQLHAPAWTPIVSVHDSGQDKNVNIYVRREKGHTLGMVIVAAEPRELTVVNLVGDMDLASLARLRGRFGVPNVPLNGGKSGS